LIVIRQKHSTTFVIQPIFTVPQIVSFALILSVFLTVSTAFINVFAQLRVNNTVPLSRILIRITPYDAVHDKLSLVGNNNYDYNLLTSMDARGTYTIMTHRPELFNLDDWNRIINFPAYKLDLDVRIFFFLILPILFL
jgi:hypothetical protein